MTGVTHPQLIWALRPHALPSPTSAKADCSSQKRMLQNHLDRRGPDLGPGPGQDTWSCQTPEWEAAIFASSAAASFADVPPATGEGLCLLDAIKAFTFDSVRQNDSVLQK